MARTKSSKKHTPKHPEPFMIIGVSTLIAHTRAITRTSERLAAALEAFSKAQVLPPPEHQHTRIPTPIQVADTKAEAAIELQLRQMTAQLSALRALSGSPALRPHSAAVSCQQWVHNFYQELDAYQRFFDDTVQVRGDAAWAIDLFSSFDRSGLACGGAELAISREEWDALVDEVLGDALDERYGCSSAERGEEEEGGKEEEGEEEEEEEEEEEPCWDASGVDLTIGGKEVEYVASEWGEAQEVEDEVEMGVEVEGISKDAVDVLQVLAEGYTAWFLGLAQEWNEACMGPDSEMEWSVVQLVKSQYAVPGLGSDAFFNWGRLETVF